MATEKNKQISISKFDVDPEGDFLQLIVDCPSDFRDPDSNIIIPGYHFTEMQITIYNKNYRDQNGHVVTYDFSTAVFGDDVERTSHWMIKIPLTFNMENGEVVPSMYKLHISAQKNKLPISNDDTSDLLSTIDAITQDDDNDIISSEAWTSDLRHVYDCMTSSILNSDPCDGVPDSVIRNEVILQGHLLALRNQRTAEALEYFILLNNCGSKCEKTSTHFSPCNCGR